MLVPFKVWFDEMCRLPLTAGVPQSKTMRGTFPEHLLRSSGHLLYGTCQRTVRPQLNAVPAVPGRYTSWYQDLVASELQKENKRKKGSEIDSVIQEKGVV